MTLCPRRLLIRMMSMTGPWNHPFNLGSECLYSYGRNLIQLDGFSPS